MGKSSKRRIWRCPKCRRWLPQKGAVHTCLPAVPLSRHFQGKNPVARELFEAVRAELKKIGRVRMDSTKTRIAFRVWTNFLELTPQKSALRGCLTLPRAVRDARFSKVVSLSPRIHYHYFKLSDRKQIDASFRRLLTEAFVIGRREHLSRPLPKERSTWEAPGGRGPSTRLPAAGRLRTSHRARRGVGVAAKERKKPLWRCPKCGWEFATRNLWHSCVRVPLNEHFKGKDPLVRKTFDALVAAVRKNGPATVVTSKTRITLMVRMRFLSVTPQKHALTGGFGLMHAARHTRLRPGLRYGGIFGHRFRLTHPKQIDPAFRRLLAEAYAVGEQKHLEPNKVLKPQMHPSASLRASTDEHR